MQNIDSIGSGRQAGCPFCSAMLVTHFVPNERIRFLSGSRAGKEATVVEPSEMFKNNPSMILVQMDEDDLSTQQMVRLDLEIIEKLPYMPIPAWAPPISIRKTCELHEHITNFCNKNSIGSVDDINWSPLYALIWHIWNRRLPLTSDEVWNVLEAHGVPKSWRNRITNILEHGSKLLITMVGKKPIKKLRIPPMAVTLSSKYGFSE